MDFQKFLECSTSSKEFIEDAVMSSSISDVIDTPENPVKHPEDEVDKVDIK